MCLYMFIYVFTKFTVLLEPDMYFSPLHDSFDPPGQPGESTGHHSRASALLDTVDDYRQL